MHVLGRCGERASGTRIYNAYFFSLGEQIKIFDRAPFQAQKRNWKFNIFSFLLAISTFQELDPTPLSNTDKICAANRHFAEILLKWEMIISEVSVLKT